MSSKHEKPVKTRTLDRAAPTPRGQPAEAAAPDQQVRQEPAQTLRKFQARSRSNTVRNQVGSRVLYQPQGGAEQQAAIVTGSDDDT
jgi:hypothetical protein